MSEIGQITKILNGENVITDDQLDLLFQKRYPEVKKIANAQLRKIGHFLQGCLAQPGLDPAWRDHVRLTVDSFLSDASVEQLLRAFTNKF